MTTTTTTTTTVHSHRRNPPENEFGFHATHVAAAQPSIVVYCIKNIYILLM